MATAPLNPSTWPLYSDTPRYFWWQSGTLFHAQRGGLDPSEIYTSTDLADALAQVGYDADRHVLVANDSPDLEWEQF